jgi:dienelactone hydrolase
MWDYLGDPVFKFWKDDARFALDRLEALNRDPGPLQGKLDLTRIGAFGWSFGGALAVQLTRDDPRVIAAVNHDGQLFDDVRQAGTSRPVMLIHHGIDDALEFPEKDRPMVRELMSETSSWDSTARIASTADWYDVTVAGTEHGNFSDLVLFLKQPAGRTEPRRAHEVINAYTVGFFDQYLKGKPSDLLSATTSPFPEAKLEAWRK